MDAVYRRAAVLAPGWEVSVQASGWPDTAAVVSLRHPLSNGHQIIFGREQVDAIDLSLLEAHLTHCADEFAQIARAPICPHAKLLRGIRALSDAFRWPASQVAGLGGVLHGNGALTTAEYEWLRENAWPTAGDAAGTESPAEPE